MAGSSGDGNDSWSAAVALGATDAELDSLAALIRSQLHVSLVRLLREP